MPWFLFVVVGVVLIAVGLADSNVLAGRGSPLMFGVIFLLTAVAVWRRQRR